MEEPGPMAEAQRYVRVRVRVWGFRLWRTYDLYGCTIKLSLVMMMDMGSKVRI
jgi:hypothetical protein